MKLLPVFPASLFLAFAGCDAGGSASAAPLPEPESAPTPRPAVYAPAAAAGSVLDRLPDVAERSVKSVVNISSTKTAPQPQGRTPFDDPFFRKFFRGMPAPGERSQRSLGSGVIVDAKGVILTNNHVVQDADEIVVALSDDREYDAELVGTDPASDLAVIRLTDPPSDLESLSFGDSAELRLGEAVIAIGNPFGVGQTVTLGIVSATGRTNVGIVDYADFIQTDAAINPGNSGGALVNMKGELVGINTAILSRSGGYQGIGFAIPSNMAETLMTDLLDDGQVSRGFLGVFIQDLTPQLAEAMSLPRETKGVVVSDVMEDGPADEGGVRPGDVILTVDGKETDSAARLRLVIAGKGGEQKVQIRLLREGRPKTISVKLREKDVEQTARATPESEPSLGLRLGALTPELREQLRLGDAIRSGAVVMELRPGSPAAESGLRRGDVILEINRAPVRGPDDAAASLKKAEGDILLRVQRGSGSMFVVIER